MADEMIDWLRQQIAEDEQWALAASAPSSWRGNHAPVASGVRWTWAVGENWEPYQVNPLEEYVGDSANDYGPTLVTVDEWPYDEPMGRWTHFQRRVIGHAEEVRSVDGGHIVRHDPARVLREVAAKRAILEDFEGTAAWAAELRAGGEADDVYARRAGTLLEVLKHLAEVYRDRPGFRPEWGVDHG